MNVTIHDVAAAQHYGHIRIALPEPGQHVVNLGLVKKQAGSDAKVKGLSIYHPLTQSLELRQAPSQYVIHYLDRIAVAAQMRGYSVRTRCAIYTNVRTRICIVSNDQYLNHNFSFSVL
jgi:hypothetical protein